jgi:hypothetical protein
MIANLLEGMEHEEAARLAGLSRSAAYEWHNRYEEDGIEGLRDRPRPGRQPRVDAVTSARFKERIVAGAELQRDGVVAFRDEGRITTTWPASQQRGHTTMITKGVDANGSSAVRLPRPRLPRMGGPVPVIGRKDRGRRQKGAERERQQKQPEA